MGRTLDSGEHYPRKPGRPRRTQYGVVQGGHRDRLVRLKIAGKSARLKSQVFEVRGATQGLEGSVSSAIEMVGGGIQRGSGIYAHDREGVSKISRGGWRGGWASMTPRGRGGQTCGRVVLFA